MTFLLGEIWLWLLPAFLIGVATGFLMARYSERTSTAQAEDGPLDAPSMPAEQPMPVAKPMQVAKPMPVAQPAPTPVPAPGIKAVPKDMPDAGRAARSPAGLHVIREDTPAIAEPPAPQPIPEPAAFSGEPDVSGIVDDLTILKGVGPKLRDTLHSLGITNFRQIAAWSDLDVLTFDMKLGQFRGRIVRDQWVEQARLLAAGNREAFEARFGKSDGDA